METHTFKKIGDLQIHADVYLADRESKKEKLPAILFIHGGGLILGHRKAIVPNHIQALNEAGFHFISIDYRLAPETKLAGILEDIQDAWHWLHGNAEPFGIDPARVAVMGHSAGAFLTLTCGTRLNPRPAALVSLAGYGKLRHEAFSTPSEHYLTAHAPANEDEARQMVGSEAIASGGRNDSIQRFTGRGLYYLFCRQQGIWLSEVSGYSSNDEALAQFEPVHNISAEYPPTMLLHGDPDTDIPVEQSILMAQELTRQGVANKLIRNPNWSHAFIYIPDESVDRAFEQIIAFFQEHT